MIKSTLHGLFCAFLTLGLYGCAAHLNPPPASRLNWPDRASSQLLDHFIHGVVLDQQGEITNAIGEYRRALQFDSTVRQFIFPWRKIISHYGYMMMRSCNCSKRGDSTPSISKPWNSWVISIWKPGKCNLLLLWPKV